MLKAGFQKILERMKADGAKGLQWEHLDPTSFTNEVIAAYGATTLELVKSVKIDIDKAGYGNNFCGLSKHARQNIRTAYNRVLRSGHEMEFKFFSNLGIGHKFPNNKGICAYRKVYKMRQEMRYGRHAGLKHSIVLKYCNYTTMSVPGEVGFLAALHIRDDVAAYMEGYINSSSGALEIPRLAIGAGYDSYSPGLLLISECAKFLLHNTKLRIIDLCRGAEPYKIAAGGEVYNTYKKIVRL